MSILRLQAQRKQMIHYLVKINVKRWNEKSQKAIKERRAKYHLQVWKYTQAVVPLTSTKEAEKKNKT